MLFKFIVFLTLLWLPSFILDPEVGSNLFVLRKHLVIYSGTLLLGFIFAATLLAFRFQWVEKWVDGLDKGYQWHKQFGLAAGIALLVHWLLIVGGEMLIERGLMPPPPPPPFTGEPPLFIKVALTFADVSLYAFALVILVAVIDAISYRQFQRIHKWSGVAIIVGVVHALVFALLNFGDGKMNIALFGVIVALGLGALILAMASLFGRIGKRRQVNGKVIEVTRYGNEKSGRVARIKVQLDAPIRYREAQFAYLGFAGEAPHPFTILNYDAASQQVVFAIKALGDFTRDLVEQVHIEQPVRVEGGYGRFQTSAKSRQVWIGAGIGITPMISRLSAISAAQAKPQIDLYYAVAAKTEAYFADELTQLAERAGVTLHLVYADEHAPLNGRTIVEQVSHLDFEVSFCGPQAFADALKTQLIEQGFNTTHFRQEAFVLR
ncbi:oxidoreductase [Vibrio sp. SM6]|uniref:Oxidoreductase n=1 Tax=Vibrio agarilyticus TaxID=2726741 RepID=A0A7X8TQI4_9VIBR|nr:ferric reductase-like transmembrane domain-containing protein [Vibrio agarilyticus]NLS12900.1 oxidoreductase [Vibrio agarilyticus]